MNFVLTLALASTNTVHFLECTGGLRLLHHDYIFNLPIASITISFGLKYNILLRKISF